jgi:hypothetical protein
MTDAAFQALKVACQRQISWLQEYALAYEQGNSRHLKLDGNASHDVSMEVAEEFRHQANNLQTVIAAYERLRTRPPGE